MAPAPGRKWLVAGTQLVEGTQKTAAAKTQATVWTSPNALSWSKTVLPAPQGTAATTSTAADAASYWGQRAIVVGSAGTGQAMRAAVWLSAGPGRPFSPVPGSPALDPPSGSLSGAVMDCVAAGALGIFAAGTVAGRTTLWYSTDGLHWSVLTGADSVVNASPGAVVDDLLITPNGVFAAGSSVNSDRTSAALWYSSDGIHWATVQSAPSAFFGTGDRLITALVDIGESGNPEPGTPAPTGLLAVGGTRVGATWQPASWISPNGFSWSETSNSFPLDAEPSGTTGAVVYAATGVGGRLLAVGGSSARQRLWESPDGQAWSEIALPAAAANDRHWHLGLLAASTTTTVLADNLPGQPYLLVYQNGSWHEPSATGVFGKPLPTAVPTSLVTDNGKLVMSVQVTDPGQDLGTSTTWVAVLTSSNGRTWKTASTGSFSQAHVNQLLPVQAGVLAVGSRSVRVSSRSGSLRTSGHLTLRTAQAAPSQIARRAFASVSSGLGSTWPEVALSSAAPAGTTTTAVAVGRAGKAYFIAGLAGNEAVYWYSPDGTTWQGAKSLDQQPQLGIERPLAACSGTGTAVVVGDVTETARGRLPDAWVTSNGSNWSNATFSSSPAPGSSSSMDGCLFTGNSFIAYGGSTGDGYALEPALWASPDGTVWDEEPTGSFSAFSTLSATTTTTRVTQATSGRSSGTGVSQEPAGPPGPGGLGGSS
ncbi:MAG: hypothetical protein ACP5VR_01895, partial [Acidimicrobiales bacterium]